MTRTTSLTTYQQHHLRPTYDHHAPYLFGPMVRASQAHVVMLVERGLIPAERGTRLLRGLGELRAPAGSPEAAVPPPFDGSVEDVYYLVEKRLAEACGIPTAQLDVQLARSRNDLDAGVFRMVLRGQLLDVLDRVLATAATALSRADRYADVVITGYTHRRPAQPTTIGHALAGYAEALAGEAVAYADLLDQLNRSPLGACAFAGTDLDIAPARVAELLGFAGLVTNSYEAVAGADHLVRVATLNAQSLATGARLARTLMDWLSWRWVETPEEFTQGSSIMPQKRNPVVLEHLVSMAGAAAGDAASVLNNVGAAWWEDSNNATTDVQVRLWESCDRAERFFALLGGFLDRLVPLAPPSREEIVRSGATTTAAADALSRHGVPFRAAHSVVGVLVRAGTPDTWTVQQVQAAAGTAGVAESLDEAAAADLISAAVRPELVLVRAQADGPGTAAVRAQVETLRAIVSGVRDRGDALRVRLADADQALDKAVDGRMAQ
ncbi:argininosuccinate lyase [Plantactinospora sp. KLBMP9567]|uniref:argininosuccinate lyase n=1 Tax=Plantactinospora sp. KLBMP9567 TaxID=3085900 RepID=UPI0029813AF0|nr:lyase family protein [Plantactinospora sp. KLBMP9567]MDW5328411.1 lyase family protein [Plantactinospora sp. KLBMP9567]